MTTKHRPSVDPSALSQVLRRYPQLGEFKAVTRNGLSVNTACCLFETSTGVYFAKRYDPRTRSEVAIASEHGIIKALLAGDFPTPLLHANNRGDTLTWLAEVPYALYERARGEDRYCDTPVFAPYDTHDEARAAGRMLARFHTLLSSLERPPARPFAGLTAQFEAWEADSLAEGLAPLMAADPGLAADLAARPEWPEVLAKHESRQPALRPQLAGLPRGILHGDWIKRNLFWEGTEVADVLDFELWNHGILAYDLALALLPTGFNWPELFQDRGQPAVADMQAFLAGYETVRPLTPGEREALPLLMEGARLEFYLSGLAAALQAHNRPQITIYWDVLVGSARWFRTHPDWAKALRLGAGS